MANDHIPADRRNRIMRMVSERGMVRVGELSRLFAVSEITVRRDLDDMERAGLLKRAHGGAVSLSGLVQEPPYAQKHHSMTAEKQAIAQAVLRFVSPGDTLFINSGSTNVAVIRGLFSAEIPGVRIVTSNVGALQSPIDDRLELIVLGGVYRPQSNSLVGTLATRALEQVHANKAIIGVDGVSPDAGITTPNHLEAEIARVMIERTRGPIIVVADHSKIGRVSAFVTAAMSRVDVLVSDAGLPADQAEQFAALGIEVVIAGPV